MQEQAISPYVIPGLLINETYIEVQVLKHFKVTPEELRGKDRHHDIVLARAITISLIKIVCKTRLLLLGQLYYKDHATVLHYFTMIAALYCTDKNTRELI